MNMLKALNHILNVLLDLLLDALRFPSLTVRSGVELRAENLFFRKQLAFYAERKIKARRINDGARLLFVFLSKLFDWKNALVIVKPETLIHWHRKGFRLFWHRKSKRRGRPRLSIEIQKLILKMAEENIT
jgi:putative transposase